MPRSLPETLEEESAKHGLLAKASAEQRHHDDLHDELQRNAEWYADRQRARPAPWGCKAECLQRGLRQLSPDEDEHGAEGHDKEVASQDDEQRQQANWAEAAELRRHVLQDQEPSGATNRDEMRYPCEAVA